MSNKPKNTLLALALTSVFPLNAYANEHNHEHHDHEQAPHVHGIVNIDMVIDNNMLMMELDSPAINLVGFEHEPESKAEHESIDKAQAALEDVSKWLTIGNGECTLTKAKASSSFEDEDHHDEEHKHDHDKHEHAKHDEHDHDKHEHDHAKHDEHDHDHDKHEHAKHDDHDHDHEQHNAFHAEYQYLCKQPEAIKRMTLSLSNQFNGIEEIELKWIVNGKQGLNLLAKGQTNVNF